MNLLGLIMFFLVLITHSANALPPVVNITYPNSGENISIQFLDVNWTASDPENDTILLTLYHDNDQNKTNGRILISDNEPNDGNFMWNLLDILNDEYYISIDAIAGYDIVTDYTDKKFTKLGFNMSYTGNSANGSVKKNLHPSVSVADPPQPVRGLFLIEFNVSDPDGDVLSANIYYSLSADGKENFLDSVHLPLACSDTDSNTSTTNNCSYILNSSLIEGNFYIDVEVSDALLSITNSTGLLYFDNFPELAVTFPNGGENVSNSTEINWSASDILGFTIIVDIYYDIDNVTLNGRALISSGEENDGEFFWDMSEVFNDDYFISIDVSSSGQDNLGNNITLTKTDYSDSFFTKTGFNFTFEGNVVNVSVLKNERPTVHVLDPNGGEYINTSLYTIIFNYSDTDPSSADIYFSQIQGGKENLIIENLDLTDSSVCIVGNNNTCYFIWNISSSGLLNGNFFIDVEVADSVYHILDSSDSSFIIDSIPEISGVSSSNITNSSALITWLTNEPANSTVFYGFDINYSLVASDPNFVQNHSILLENLTGNRLYHFKVESCDATGNCVQSDDHNFTTLNNIHTIQVLYPNGGENITTGFIDINWSASDIDNDQITIDIYYDVDTNPLNGRTIITPDEENDGSYLWNLVNVPNGNFYISIDATSPDYFNNTNITITDYSDSFFTKAVLNVSYTGNIVNITVNKNNRPTIEVIDPNGGEYISGLYTIAFNVSDPDNDFLSADIFFSQLQDEKENSIVRNLDLSDLSVCTGSVPEQSREKTWTTQEDWNSGVFVNTSTNPNGTLQLSYGELDPENNMVLLYHFNNDSTVGENYTNEPGVSEIIFDYSFARNNGTTIGDPFYNATGGKFAGAFEIDGSNDYIQVQSPYVDLPSVWTIEAWFKVPLAAMSSWNTLTRGNAGDHQIIVRRSDMQLGMYDNADAFRGTGFYVSSLQEGWHHIAAVGSNGVQDFYVDGQWVGQSDRQSTTDIRSIGNYFGGGQTWGTIDEVVIYNRTLTPEKILNHYRRGFNITQGKWNGIYDAGRVAEWNTISWNELLPEGTDIKTRTRTAQTNDELINAEWSEYYIENSSIESPINRFIEIQALLTTEDVNITPILNDITINFFVQNSTCYYNWDVNSSGANGDYFIDIEVTDSVNKVMDSSDSSFTVSTPPEISGITASNITTTSAVITWLTNKPANSTVYYGLDTDYGFVASDSNMVQNHSMLLENLTGNKLYHYKVGGCDMFGFCTQSEDNTFITQNNLHTVQVLYPNGGENITTGFIDINWLASDIDNDNITIELYYDVDSDTSNGRFFITTTDNDGSFVWNIQGIPNGNYFVSIDASSFDLANNQTIFVTDYSDSYFTKSLLNLTYVGNIVNVTVSRNTGPDVEITSPQPFDTLIMQTNINFTVSDPNADPLIGNLYYSGEIFKQQLFVTNNLGQNIFDYPILLIMDTASLISQGKMRPDAVDLKILVNGIEVPIFIESGLNTNETKIWFSLDLLDEETRNDAFVSYGPSTAIAMPREEPNWTNFLPQPSLLVGQAVTATSEDPSYPATNSNDGNPGTKWVGTGETDWLKFSLNKTYKPYKVSYFLTGNGIAHTISRYSIDNVNYTVLVDANYTQGQTFATHFFKPVQMNYFLVDAQSHIVQNELFEAELYEPRIILAAQGPEQPGEDFPIALDLDLSLPSLCNDPDSNTSTPNNCSYLWNLSLLDGIFCVKAIVVDTLGISGEDEVCNITIDNINDYPRLIQLIPNQTWAANTNQTINLSLYFIDPNGDELNYSSTQPENITVLIDNVIKTATLVPDFNFTGSRSIIFTATDPSGASTNSNLVILTVSNPPYLVSPIPDQTWNKNNILEINLSLYFAEPDGEDLNFSSTKPQNISVSINNDTGIAMLIPDLNWFGINNIIFTAFDIHGLSADSNLVLLNVTGFNNPPAMETIQNITANETGIVTIIIIASDPDNDTLYYFINDTRFNQSNNVFTWQTTHEDEGNHSVMITVSDNENNVSQVVYIEIFDVNAPPTISGLPDINITEDSGFNDDLINLIDYATDLETPAENLSYSIIAETNPEIVDCEIDANNFVDCTTQENTFGQSNITIEVSDGMATDNDTFSVNVTPVNDPPVLVQDIPDQLWQMNTNNSIDLSLYFFDVDGDTLYYSSSPTENITITIVDSIALLVPEEDWAGTEYVVFTANDSLLTASSNLVTLQVEDLLLTLTLTPPLVSQGGLVIASGNLSLTNGSFITNNVVEIFLNETRIGSDLTDSQGIYSFMFQAPQEIGTYQIKANSTFANFYTEAFATLDVKNSPTISNVSHEPLYPKPTENVTVNATITDDGYVASALLFYSLDNQTWSNTTMTNISIFYNGTIPSTVVTSNVYYYIEAVDNDNLVSMSPIFSYISDGTPPSITGIVHSPSYPTPYENVTVNASVSDNLGVSGVTLLYSFDNITWNSTPMESQNGVYSAIIPPPNFQTTAYYIINAIDIAGNEINSTTFSYPAMETDLIVNAISVQGTPVDGGYVVFNVTIQNTGSGDVAASTTVGFYIDNNLLPFYTITPLAPNQTAHAFFSWVAFPGEHNLTAIADFDDTISEINESNNAMLDQVVIPFPDLTVTNISMPETIRDGETISINATVKNIGAYTKRDFSVEFNIDNVSIGSFIVEDGLLPDQSIIASILWTADAGSHIVTVRADSTNIVLESDETNNELSSQIPFVRFPDIVVLNISWTPIEPVYQDTVIFNGTIKNIGEGDTLSTFYVKFLIDSNSIGTVPVNGLLANQTKSVTTSWNALAGNHTVTLRADSTNIVSESNEANNELSMPINVPGVFINPDRVSVWLDQNITFTVNLTNNGASVINITEINTSVSWLSITTPLPIILVPGSSEIIEFLSAEPSETETHTVVLTFSDGNVLYEQLFVTVLDPLAVFSVTSPDPSHVNVTPGEQKLYRIDVRNLGTFQGSYLLSVAGLDESWYSLSPDSLTINPGQTQSSFLDINIPLDCDLSGIIEFNVSVLHEQSSVSKSLAFDMNITSNPIISNIFPPNSSLLGSNDVLFTWETNVNSSTELFSKAENESSFTQYNGTPGQMHSIIIANLTRNMNYTFYVSSGFICGSAASDALEFTVGNGVVFTQRYYNFSVNRDYDQHVNVTVNNTNSVPHTMLATVINPYTDLIVGFVGNGSMDQNLTLLPGEEKNLEFVIHAQDAVQTQYDLMVNLTDLSEPITDYAQVHINIIIPNVNFTLAEIASDSTTLEKQFRLDNFGDTITDMSVFASENIGNALFYEPAIDHALMEIGDTIIFNATPMLAAGMTGINGSLIASGVNTNVSIPVDFSCEEGKQLFLGQMPSALSISFSPLFDEDNLSFTNPVESVPIDTFLINNSLVFRTQVLVEVKQGGAHVYGTDIILKVWSSTSQITLNGTTDPLGFVIFEVYGPAGNYSYQAEIEGQNIFTEIRKMEFHQTPLYTILPDQIEWVTISDSNTTVEMNSSVTQVTLDSLPYDFEVRVNISEPLVDGFLYITYFEPEFSRNISLEIPGNITGNTIIFNRTFVPEGNYTVNVYASTNNKLFGSRDVAIEVTDISHRTLQINYSTSVSVALNETHAIQSNISQYVLVDDPKKIVSFYMGMYANMEYLLIYSITANETLNDTVTATVMDADSGDVLFNDTIPVSVIANTTTFFNITFDPHNFYGDPVTNFEITVTTLNRESIWTTIKNGYFRVFPPGTWKILMEQGGPFKAHNYWQLAAKCTVTALLTVYPAFSAGGAFEGFGETTGIVVGSLDTLGSFMSHDIPGGIRGSSELAIGFYNNIDSLHKTPGFVKFTDKFGKGVSILGCFADWLEIKSRRDAQRKTIRESQDKHGFFCTNRPVIDVDFTFPDYINPPFDACRRGVLDACGGFPPFPPPFPPFGGFGPFVPFTTGITMHSPAELHVYDLLGNHVGSNPEGGIDTQIPDSMFIVEEDKTTVVLPNPPSSYTIKTKAISSGNFTLTVSEKKGSQIGIMTYSNITQMNNTETMINISASTDYTMDIDIDGDGIIDNTTAPNIKAYTFEKPNLLNAHVEITFRVVTPNIPPHKVLVYINDFLIANMTNVVPDGKYIFPVDPSYLNYASTGTVAQNTVTVKTRGMNGGNYVTVSNIKLITHLSERGKLVCASSQEEADEIIANLSDVIVNETDIGIYRGDITFSNSTPRDEDIVTINASVRNLGVTDLWLVPVEFYDGDPDEGGVLIESGTIEFIQVFTQESISIDWIASVGTHKIYVKVDPNSETIEKDETNNIAFEPIAVRPTKPAVRIIHPVNNSVFIYGDPIVFEGEAIDPEDGILTGPALVWISSIDGFIGTNNYFILNNLSVGNHTINLTATDSEGFTGSDFSNIEIVEYFPYIDLSIFNITYSPQFPNAGGNVTIDAIVKNQGNTQSGSFLVELLVNNISIENKTADISGYSNQTLTFYWIATLGINNITIRADPENVIEELNETNNEMIIVIEVLLNTPPSIEGLPDVNITEDSGLNDNLLYLLDYATDNETSPPNLSYAVINQTNTNVVFCSVDPDNYLDCTTQPDAFGASDVTIEVNDGEFTDNDTLRVTVLPENDAPILDSIGNKTVDENETLIIDVNATDVDNDTLTYYTNAGDVLPSSFSFDSVTGLFEWTPTFDDAGEYNIVFNVTDSELWDEEIITITVNDVVLNNPPVLDPIGNKTINENETLIIDVNATDPDNDTLTYYTNAGDVLPSPFTFNNSNGMFEWTPTFDDAGEYNVTFNVTDWELWDEETIIIAVNDVNRPPELDSIGNREIDENETLIIDVNATDPDNDTLTYYTNADEVLLSDFTFDQNTGLFEWIPTFDDAGIYNVTFNVTDGELWDEETITITVNDVILNQPPILEPIGDQQTNEAETLIIDVNASDPDNDSLTYFTNAGEVLPSAFIFDSVTGLFTWTPTYFDSGEYNVMFNVTDGELWDSETITITVIDVLIDVELRDPYVSTLSNFTPNGTIYVEFDAFNNEDITLYNVSLKLDTNSNDPDIEFRIPIFRPYQEINFILHWNYSQPGMYQPFAFIDYTEDLPEYDEDNNIVGFGIINIISVTVINYPPVLDPIGDKIVNENETLIIDVNATDPNNDTLTYFTDAESVLPSNFTFNQSNGLFIWTPTYSDSGRYNVTFNVTDGQLWDSETITITVINVRGVKRPLPYEQYGEGGI